MMPKVLKNPPSNEMVEELPDSYIEKHGKNKGKTEKSEKKEKSDKTEGRSQEREERRQEKKRIPIKLRKLKRKNPRNKIPFPMKDLESIKENEDEILNGGFSVDKVTVMLKDMVKKELRVEKIRHL